jgi:hypothetical protein
MLTPTELALLLTSADDRQQTAASLANLLEHGLVRFDSDHNVIATASGQALLPTLPTASA